MQITKAELHKLPSRYASLKSKLTNVRKEGEKVVEKVLRTAETSGTAFGLGLINGYHGPVTVAKVPLELLLAGLFEIGGYLGLAGKHSDHLNNIGDGALSAFAVVKGVQIGAEIKAKHTGTSTTTTTKGIAAPDANAIRAMVEQSVAENLRNAAPVAG